MKMKKDADIEASRAAAAQRIEWRTCQRIREMHIAARALSSEEQSHPGGILM